MNLESEVQNEVRCEYHVNTNGWMCESQCDKQCDTQCDKQCDEDVTDRVVLHSNESVEKNNGKNQ